jgi:hypothetical protein
MVMHKTRSMWFFTGPPLYHCLILTNNMHINGLVNWIITARVNLHIVETQNVLF